MTDAEQMVELLTYANYAKVAAALRVSRNAVSAWARGKDVTPYRVRQVRDLLRPPSPLDGSEEWARALLDRISQAAPQTETAAPPKWAERPLALVNLLAEKSGITEEQIAAEADRLAAAADASQLQRVRAAG